MAVAVFSLLPAAYAHSFGADSGAGFVVGFAHPFLGLDHLAAMVAVGLWAAQRGGDGAWRVPLAFVAMMVVGAALAFAGAGLPAVEAGIGASVLVLGLLLAAAVRLPALAAMALIGAFAVFHGYAHAAELPLTASPWLYAAGFLLATAILHATGWYTGRALRAELHWATRAAGLALAGGGVWMLMA